MAGELNAATEEASQLRKQLSALGAQLDAASSQISQQQAAIAALGDTKKELQVRQGSGSLLLLLCKGSAACNMQVPCTSAVCSVTSTRPTYVLLPVANSYVVTAA
jgi:chaperonin cofactor prefoldin